MCQLLFFDRKTNIKYFLLAVGTKTFEYFSFYCKIKYMSETKNKKGSIAKKILLIFAIIILIIAVVIFGGYFYLKYTLKIDILEIKRAINLLNKPFNESIIVDNGFDDVGSSNAFFKLYQNELIYNSNGEEYIFTKEEFDSSSIGSETVLNDHEFASIVSVLIKNLEEENLTGITKGISLNEISFLSYESGEENTLRIKYVVKIDLSFLKDSTGESLFDILSLKKYIPQSIYFSCEQDVFIDFFYENFSSNNCDILINNLTPSESATILNFISQFLGSDTDSLKKDLSKIFPTIIFGDDEREGLIKKILGEKDFSFIVDEDIVKLKVTP